MGSGCPPGPEGGTPQPAMGGLADLGGGAIWEPPKVNFFLSSAVAAGFFWYSRHFFPQTVHKMDFCAANFSPKNQSPRLHYCTKAPTHSYLMLDHGGRKDGY